MPTTSPLVLSKGPPLFPGLIGGIGLDVRDSAYGCGRAEMMPLVTVICFHGGHHPAGSQVRSLLRPRARRLRMERTVKSDW